MNLRFTGSLLLTAAVTGAFYFFLLQRLPVNLTYGNYIYILTFFTLTTFLFHTGLEKSAASGTKSFIRFYMLATALKLLLYVGAIVIYALINKPGAMGFAFCFLIHYVLFTVFEVLMAYRQFGNLKKSQ